jgi:tetrahydromethanopterin S-methyltransferase subunit G
MSEKTINEVAIMLENHIENEAERHDVFDCKLDEINQKLSYTNGNVRDLLLWRAYMLGGLSILTMLVIPMIIYIWNSK